MGMLLSELAGAQTPSGLGNIEITGLTSDSRQVAPGYLFAALPGTQVDGARFIDDAVAAGAAVILGPKTLPPGVAGTVPVLRDENPRRALALMAAKFAGAQPETIVAVTGTNGKTSVAAFVRQIWSEMGLRAASLGTTGIIGPGGETSLQHTTPEPVALHGMLNELAASDVTHLAMEASSHGLQQNRLDGVKVAAAAFTNLTRDHLDYHADFEEYFAAKMRLFNDVLEEGATAVVNADMPESNRIVVQCRERGLNVMMVGENGSTIKLVSQQRQGFAQRLKLSLRGDEYSVKLPLVGGFQASNALMAAGLVIATGGKPADVFKALEHLEGAKGRLDLVATADCDAPVFVDYAHTPDALETALDALRPYVGNRLAVVFGCGGDRDKGKRPQMGAVADAKADIVYVTDDNPRSEEPGAIRAEIMAACPRGIEIGDRAQAIRRAVANLERGDVLLVAGKGHETGQIVGVEVIPFSDHDAVQAAVTAGADVSDLPLWTAGELVDATGGRLVGKITRPLEGVSIDSRTIDAGDIFIAIVGENSDGHDYVVKALEAGAGLAVVARETPEMRSAGALLVVDDTLDALGAIGRAARDRSTARIVAVTGSVGKTSTKEALLLALSKSGATHASPASYNNHWGVPLSLARMPRNTTFGILEIGMNHAGEITPLTKMARPHVAIITQIAESHLGHFNSLDDIADAKAEIFAGVEPGGSAVIVRDSPYFDRLSRAAEQAGLENIVSFGRHEAAEFRVTNLVLHSTCSCVTADLMGEDACYKLGAPGEHVVMNSLAVLGAVKLAGGDLAKGALALAHLEPPKGRGVRSRLMSAAGPFLLIDESYNANPASVRAALALMGQLKPQGRGRRIAVLGDMLELGEHSEKLHTELADAVKQNSVDVVFACGPQMMHLWQKLPASMRGAYAERSAGLCDELASQITPGDVVMIKGSLGSRMAVIVDALKETFPARTRTPGRRGDLILCFIT